MVEAWLYRPKVLTAGSFLHDRAGNNPRWACAKPEAGSSAEVGPRQEPHTIKGGEREFGGVDRAVVEAVSVQAELENSEVGPDQKKQRGGRMGGGGGWQPTPTVALQPPYPAN